MKKEQITNKITKLKEKRNKLYDKYLVPIEDEIDELLKELN